MCNAINVPLKVVMPIHVHLISPFTPKSKLQMDTNLLMQSNIFHG